MVGHTMALNRKGIWTGFWKVAHVVSHAFHVVASEGRMYEELGTRVCKYKRCEGNFFNSDGALMEGNKSLRAQLGTTQTDRQTETRKSHSNKPQVNWYYLQHNTISIVAVDWCEFKPMWRILINVWEKCQPCCYPTTGCMHSRAIYRNQKKHWFLH